MESETAQATSEIPSTPRPEAWPDRWMFQHWYWIQVLRIPGRWSCFLSSQYATEKEATEAAQQHEREHGGPVRVIRIQGTDASKESK
jgi:hypothetical protein